MTMMLKLSLRLFLYNLLLLLPAGAAGVLVGHPFDTVKVGQVLFFLNRILFITELYNKPF